jgi:hypothetical protein
LFEFYIETSATNKSSTFKVETYNDGSRYEGEWMNEKQHGQGTYYFADGNKYTGGWVDDKKTGQGIHTWANGDRYELKGS